MAVEVGSRDETVRSVVEGAGKCARAILSSMVSIDFYGSTDCGNAVGISEAQRLTLDHILESVRGMPAVDSSLPRAEEALSSLLRKSAFYGGDGSVAAYEESLVLFRRHSTAVVMCEGWWARTTVY